MAVRSEPLRGRPEPKGAARYPGLAPDERASEYLSEPPPPLWVIPSEAPPGPRSVGFVAPLPEPEAEAPAPSEGLFDVPGLLERLWLARALEAHRERPWTPEVPGPEGSSRVPDPLLAPTSRSSAVSGGTPAGPPLLIERPRPTRVLTAAPAPPPSPPELVEAPIAPVGPLSRSWVCPYCYLTNEAGASTCRGCRSSSLHF